MTEWHAVDLALLIWGPVLIWGTIHGAKIRRANPQWRKR